MPSHRQLSTRACTSRTRGTVVRHTDQHVGFSHQPRELSFCTPVSASTVISLSCAACTAATTFGSLADVLKTSSRSPACPSARTWRANICTDLSAPAFGRSQQRPICTQRNGRKFRALPFKSGDAVRCKLLRMRGRGTTAARQDLPPLVMQAKAPERHRQSAGPEPVQTGISGPRSR